MSAKYHQPKTGHKQAYRKLDTSQQLRQEMPPMPTKRMVADYFGFASTSYFFRNIFFEKILPESDYSWEDFKLSKRLPAGLAAELYEEMGWVKVEAA